MHCLCSQLPPVIKNMAFQKFSNMEQSLFTRFVRLGVPTVELDAQGRARSRYEIMLYALIGGGGDNQKIFHAGRLFSEVQSLPLNRKCNHTIYLRYRKWYIFYNLFHNCSLFSLGLMNRLFRGSVRGILKGLWKYLN